MAKILLIDDDPDLRQFLQDALEERGHTVACLERAEGGPDVLATGEFDLVLVDQNMPGLSGSDFLKILRKKGLGMPAILMTGLARGPLIQEMKKLDAFVVGKPAGGFNEFWKELEPLLADALQGEAEFVTSIGRAIDAALKAGKTNLYPRLQRLLKDGLLQRALTAAGGNQDEAVRITGVPLAQLMNEEPDSKSSFLADALILIKNNPDWTALEYAQKLDCSKAKLYRNKTIVAALRMRKGGSGRSPRSGYKDADGDVDAYD